MTLIRFFIWLSICTFCIVPVTYAQQKYDYTFGVVPQQSASKLARAWQPILSTIYQKTGLKIRFQTTKDIPTFEKNLQKGLYDFSYMNPYHYVVFHEQQGYKAVARRDGSQIKGIIVVHRDSSIMTLKELQGHELAFPSPAAFAASILPRGHLKKTNISIKPRYVASHDSVYLNIARGRFIAGGGIMRTLKAVPQDIRDQLRILWTSHGYTPHAIAYHPRVQHNDAEAVGKIIVNLHHMDDMDLLQALKIKGFIKALNSDWDDVRLLKLTELE